ncbi:MAG: zinc ribbon domain-containing protein [Spirochaetales bacterium]|jgi:putative FmdB family regulatory protein|nr:zinc ribbon domain-containing protein [Spirochaetales bacterium]
MPTYEYECKSCKHRFEVLQNMSDPPLKACPKCGRAVRRLIGGGAGIIFKGSGFYITDNKKGSSGSAGSKKGPDSAGKTGDGAASAATAGEKAQKGTEKSPAKPTAKNSA